jgi:multidrug efflux system membrane fusion protein
MRRKIVMATVLLIIVAGGGAFAYTHRLAAKSSSASPASPPVTIVAGQVVQHDVPIYLTGVGTVIAYNTVVVRSQIQGQIVSINFTEGQAVHAGDLLAQIDPRPYQAQIEELTANRDRDQAQLAMRLPISSATRPSSRRVGRRRSS